MIQPPVNDLIRLKGFEPDGLADAVAYALDHDKEFGNLIEFLERAADIDLPGLIDSHPYACHEDADGIWFFTLEEYQEIVRRARHYK